MKRHTPFYRRRQSGVHHDLTEIRQTAVAILAQHHRPPSTEQVANTVIDVEVSARIRHLAELLISLSHCYITTTDPAVRQEAERQLLETFKLGKEEMRKIADIRTAVQTPPK